MKTFLRFVLLFLILVSVAMVSALTAMRFAIHGREVAVPKFAGLTIAAAEQQAAANGLILEVENRFYSRDIAVGKILTQSPVPGILVRRGWKVRVAESLGPQRAEVPDLIGQSARAAEINVRQRGLEIGSVAVANLPGAQQDEIVAQSPPPNSAVAETPNISVLVAGPERAQQFVMPNFVGKRIADVRKPIEDAGFTVLVHDPAAGATSAPATSPRTPAAPRIETGTIAKQSPTPGQRITAGNNIFFEITH